MKHPIPREALDDRLGFIGTSGSGKTYNAGTAVERLLDSKARVVIIDPLGAWWGLRLLADGKTQSKFNVVIFGGDHADLPLNEQAGPLLGETVATMAESCIIDLSKLPSRSAERRFMAGFLETAYRKAGGDLFHLVVDEADLFAPQKPQKGDEALLGHMDNIVRRGRLKGFIPWLITQRPAVLNKNVLSQVDGLLAFKLTSSQDRDALDAWIEGQADKAQGKEIKDALPTFPVGEGVVWLPGHGILDRRPFPPKVTFDSSRKPKRGEKLKSRKLKPLDVGKLQAQLATVVEEAKANDPKELRKQVADLKAQLAKAAAAKATPAPKPVADKAAIAAAEERGFEQARKKLTNAMGREVQKRTLEILATLGERLAPLTGFVGEQATTARALKTKLEIEFKSGPSAVKQTTVDTPKRAPAAIPAARKPSSVPKGGDGSLTGPQLQLLQALNWWRALGHEQPTRTQVAAIAKWKPKGSNLRNRLSELSSMGMVVYPRDGLVSLTDDGAAVAPAPDDMGLIDSLKAVMTGPQLQLFEQLLLSGTAPVTRDELATAVKWEPGGSNLRNRLSELSALEVVSYPGKGAVALQEWIVE